MVSNRFARVLAGFFTIALVFSSHQAISAQAESHLLAPMQQEIQGLIPNFGIVSPVLLRGGQPKSGGMSILKKAGVKTVVNLRDGEKDIEKERTAAKALGLNYVSIPLSVFGKVSKSEFNTFLNTVRDPKNQPVFVHCRKGQDRTGTMVAMYRMVDQSWSPDKAHQEMLDYGFHPFFVGLTSSLFALKGQVSHSNTTISTTTPAVNPPASARN